MMRWWTFTYRCAVSIGYRSCSSRVPATQVTCWLIGCCLLALFWLLPKTLYGQQTANSSTDKTDAIQAISDSAETPDSVIDESNIEQVVARLILQLGDANYHRRTNARWQLERIGLPAFEQLRLAAKFQENVEIADAAAYIIESQNIVWWLDTDSVEVRSYLTGYSSANKDKREEAILLLGKLDTPDAVFALCRLARYERFEDIAKLAALTLMEKLADDGPLHDTLIDLVDEAIGNGDRPSVQWIRLFANNVKNRGTTTEQWSEMALREIEPREGQSLPKPSVGLRLCRWIVVWITKTASKELAIETMAPNLIAATSGSAFQLKVLALWALDENLPELLIAIAQEHNTSFENSSELKYLLAEGYMQLGSSQRAEQLAATASDDMEPPGEAAQELSKKYGLQGTAYQRYRMARQLESRGLFEWAEREYSKAVAEKSDRFDSDIREAFALFYWFSGKHAEAAEVLRPVAEALETSDGSLRTVDRFDRNSKLALYYFYDGLANIDSGNLEVARQRLTKSYEFDPSNPDVVIAMKQAATTPEFQGYYRACFEEMQDLFRSIVVDLEKELVLAEDRDDRRRSEQSLARACNQLAWLLGKCREDVNEAIRLGLRATELLPETPAYLDTLARCYFSAGNFEKAIQIQSEAVRLAPHERQMAAQLAEFEQAAQDQPASAAANSP